MPAISAAQFSDCLYLALLRSGILPFPLLEVRILPFAGAVRISAIGVCPAFLVTTGWKPVGRDRQRCPFSKSNRRLLLGQAMKRSQTPDQFCAIDPDDVPIRK